VHVERDPRADQGRRGTVARARTCSTRLAGAALAAASAGCSGCTSRTKASLGEALSVEQPGGTVAQLLGQGAELPTSATESFTNAKDDERNLFVHVLRGAGRTARAGTRSTASGRRRPARPA
jgi:hypothetical protein